MKWRDYMKLAQEVTPATVEPLPPIYGRHEPANKDAVFPIVLRPCRIKECCKSRHVANPTIARGMPPSSLWCKSAESMRQVLVPE